MGQNSPIRQKNDYFRAPFSKKFSFSPFLRASDPSVRHTGVTIAGSSFSIVLQNKDVVAAGPVSRILSAGLLLRDGHSSGPRIAARL